MRVGATWQGEGGTGARRARSIPVSMQCRRHTSGRSGRSCAKPEQQEDDLGPLVAAMHRVTVQTQIEGERLCAGRRPE